MTLLRRRQTVVEAYLHDGTDVRASAIAHWIQDHGGKATAVYRGEAEYSYAQDYAVVRLDGNVLTNLVVPNFWVVNMGDGQFIAVPDSVMQVAYEVIEGEDDETVRQT